MAAPLSLRVLHSVERKSLCLCKSNYRLARSFHESHNLEKGLVLGIYEGEKENDVILSQSAEKFQALKAPKLTELINLSGLAQKKGKQRVFYGLDPEFSSVAVVSLGKKGVGYNDLEEFDEGRENVRIGVAAGVKQLKANGESVVYVDPCHDPEAASEGSNLCVYVYDELKTDEKKKSKQIELKCYTEACDDSQSTQALWDRGACLAEGHNLSKRLLESPANIVTPTYFCETAQQVLQGLSKVKVTVRDKAWAEEKKMGSFLSVAQGSAQPPMFLEIEYSGGKKGDAPLAIVGKGVTFDSGGISIKPSAGMGDMRGDMGGAACTLGAIYTAAKLQFPINVMGFMPLCENMPSGNAVKPGDVIRAMNGKTIQVDNTDAEGRLILADALVYAETFKPCGIIDMATLTGAIIVALGTDASGVFSNSEYYWKLLHKAGTITGDRMWRMPLYKAYTQRVTEGPLADVLNSTGSRDAGACTAAAFLKEFVTNKNWMHIDMAGSAAMMGSKSHHSYMSSSMTGRPTRTIVEFIYALSQERL